MTERHRVNINVTGRYRDAICADCAWIVRGVSAERADEFARHHEREPDVPHPDIPQANLPRR